MSKGNDAKGTNRTEKSVQKHNKSLSADRKEKVDKATLPKHGVMNWSVYEEEMEANLEKSNNN